MAYAGAVGPTADEMAAVLHLGAEPHVAQNALDLSLVAAGEAPVEGDGSPLILESANSIWGAPDLRRERAFLDTLALNYGAGLRLTDFAAEPEAARLDINAWVADATRDRIPNLIPEGIIDVDTAMVLVNAIFFGRGLPPRPERRRSRRRRRSGADHARRLRDPRHRR